MKIRQAGASDAGAIASLISELGYPSNADEIVARLGRLTDFPDVYVRVAERDGDVVGVATGHVLSTLHRTAPVAWLTALVVARQHRGCGLGHALVESVEQWARERGADRLSLTSGSQREGAHNFYEGLGYERSGVRFTKELR